MTLREWIDKFKSRIVKVERGQKEDVGRGMRPRESAISLQVTMKQLKTVVEYKIIF